MNIKTTCSSTPSPLREKVAESRMRRYHVGQALPDNAPKGHLSLFTRPSSSRSVLMRDIGASHGIIPGHAGFTLIEILVVVLIIGILGAIALPQYQRAVFKSRYSGMMPIAKALAEGNEVFFLEHGHYSENPADLMIAGRDKNADAYPDGTRVLMYDEDGLSYVRVMNDNVPNARYIVYQKHSENFADTTQCEAADDRADELCQALGGTLIEEGNSSGEAGWTAYILSGNYGSGDSFAETGTGNNDEPGSNTEPEPQTPADPNACQPGDTPPADIEPTETNPATGTATCVNGQWKYQWSGGNVYDTDYDSQTIVCTGDSAYKCAGSEFKGQRNKCEATQENGCADSTFSGKYAYCYGNAANGCADSTFSGQTAQCYGTAANVCAGSTFSGKWSNCEGHADNGCAGSAFSGEDSYCQGRAANVCADSTFSGQGSRCSGYAANACAGSTFSGGWSKCVGATTNGCAGAIIQAGAYCSNHCEGAKYGEDPTGQRKGIGSCSDSYGYCPNGAPLIGTWNETNGSYDIKSWKGGYCDPNLMVSGNCPAGSPKQGGGCWDGNGNQTTCS